MVGGNSVDRSANLVSRRAGPGLGPFFLEIGRILKLDESCGFEMQDSSNFKILLTEFIGRRTVMRMGSIGLAFVSCSLFCVIAWAGQAGTQSQGGGRPAPT